MQDTLAATVPRRLTSMLRFPPPILWLITLQRNFLGHSFLHSASFGFLLSATSTFDSHSSGNRCWDFSFINHYPLPVRLCLRLCEVHSCSLLLSILPTQVTRRYSITLTPPAVLPNSFATSIRIILCATITILIPFPIPYTRSRARPKDSSEHSPSPSPTTLPQTTIS